MPDDEGLHSFNMETGMVEDIEEVRELFRNVIDGFINLAASPIIQESSDPGNLFDVLFSLVLIRAALQHTSQAQLYRNMALLFGQGAAVTEREITALGMSEQYPYTSVRAARINLDRKAVAEHLRAGKLFQTSELIQEVVRVSEADDPETVHLSDALETFLHDVQEQRNKEHDDSDGSNTNHS